MKIISLIISFINDENKTFQDKCILLENYTDIDKQCIQFEKCNCINIKLMITFNIQNYSLKRA